MRLENQEEPRPGADGIPWRTKREIALHFQIGERTVTRFMNQQLLPYTKIRNLVRFDLSACDRAFRSFTVETLYRARQNHPNAPLELHRWSTKSQIAVHFGISYRTVTSLMRRRVFPHVAIGQLVRLELNECDIDYSGNPIGPEIILKDCASISPARTRVAAANAKRR